MRLTRALACPLRCERVLYGTEDLSFPESQNRNQPCKQSAEKHDSNPSQHSNTVQMNALGARDVGTRAYQPVNRHRRQQQSQHAASTTQHPALHKLLLAQPPAAAAQRRANRRLPAPCSRACDQQVRNVQATNQQQASCSSEEHQKGRLDIPYARLKQRYDVSRAEDKRIVGKPLVNASLNCARLSLRLRYGNTRLQTRENLKIMGTVRLNPLRLGFVKERSPQLHRGFGKIGTDWQHADYRVRLRVEPDGLTQNLSVAAIAALPQTPAQDDSRIRLRSVVVSVEEPSKCGLYS